MYFQEFKLPHFIVYLFIVDNFIILPLLNGAFEVSLFGNAITVCSSPVADRDDKSVHPYEPFRNILSANLISECSILFEFTHKLEAQLMELHSNAQRFDFLTLAPILQTLMLLKMRTFKTSFLFNSKMRTIYLSVTRLNFFGLWTVG